MSGEGGSDIGPAPSLPRVVVGATGEMDDLSWLLTNGAELMEGFCVSHLILCVSELCLMSFVSVCVCVSEGRG